MFLAGRGDGIVEVIFFLLCHCMLDESYDIKVWDLHYGHGEPALSVWVSHNPITTIRMNEKGDLAVAG